MANFEQAVKAAAEKAVLRIIAEGWWIEPNYEDRFKIPYDMLEDIWRLVDVEKIKAKMVERLENELADRIMKCLAAEISTDIKQILSSQERREALRAIAREHMNKIMRAGIDPA